MTIYIITDTHFGHDMLRDTALRPADFEERIWKNLLAMKEDDLLIHLGDVCMGNDSYWHNLIVKHIKARMVLVRGNHDSKSDTWYYEHSWDFVCDSFSLDKFGKKILFSHEPVPNHGLDVNIHGHWHNNDHRIQPEFKEWYNDSYKLLALEDIDYKPVNLQKFLKL
jgi:calcineurin-like phosphoesterase family protein